MAQGGGYDYSKFRDHLRDEYNRGQSSGNELILKDRATVRVLQFLDTNNRERLFREAPVHFGLRKQPVFCTESTHGYCPACEAVRAAGATGDPDEIKWAESVQAKRRYLFNVVNMDYPPEQRKVQVLSAPHTLKQAILAIYTDPAYERAVYVEGRDIILTRSGSGLNTEYNAKICIDSSDFDPALAGEVFDLDAYVDATPDLLRDLLGGRAPADEPAPARQTAVARTAAPAARAAQRRTAPAPAAARRAVNPPQQEEVPFPDPEEEQQVEAAEEVDPVTGEPLDVRPAPAAGAGRRQPPPPPPARRGAAPAAARPRR